ncbi:MAG: calcium/sodium antiporter [Hyphomicrobiales bacterium]
MDYALLAAGIAVLLVCGDLLVRGAVALAERLEIPTLIIGLTIVAFGTSAPELVVSLRAAMTGSSGIALGNVVGSNIANVLIVLGLPALIAVTKCDEPHLSRNLFYVIGASLLLIALCHFQPLSLWHGIVLFSFMIAFLVEAGRRAALGAADEPIPTTEDVETIDGVSGVPHKLWASFAFLAVGLIGLPLGAHMTVLSASAIAKDFGVSEAAIGLTLVALGTSLPELAATLAAAVRGHCGIVLGNVLGSNLFNILAIMGITAMVAPIQVPESIKSVDLWIMLAASLAIAPAIFARKPIGRAYGLAFTSAYLLYIYLVFSPEVGGVANAALMH